jgi:hypothetical protein
MRGTEERGRIARVVVDGNEGNRDLEHGLVPGLAGLTLQQIGQLVIVIKQPVAIAPDDRCPTGGPEGLPFRLGCPNCVDNTRHVGGAQVGDGAGDGAVGW